MNGICGTCGREAEATSANEGYSDCCNDRIAYGDEAERILREQTVEKAAESGWPRVELLGSWGQVEGRGYLSRETTYYGRRAAVILNDKGFEGLYLPGQWRKVAS